LPDGVGFQSAAGRRGRVVAPKCRRSCWRGGACPASGPSRRTGMLSTSQRLAYSTLRVADPYEQRCAGHLWLWNTCDQRALGLGWRGKDGGW